MAVDFSALVLRPAMDTFAVPVTVTPSVSQPGEPAYVVRGVWGNEAVTVELQDGSYHSTTEPTLGIRLSEFAVVPAQGDGVLAGEVSYIVIDVRPDGQGGAVLHLRQP